MVPRVKIRFLYVVRHSFEISTLFGSYYDEMGRG